MDYSVIPFMASSVFTCESSAAHGPRSSVCWSGNSPLFLLLKPETHPVAKDLFLFVSSSVAQIPFGIDGNRILRFPPIILVYQRFAHTVACIDARSHTAHHVGTQANIAQGEIAA